MIKIIFLLFLSAFYLDAIELNKKEKQFLEKHPTIVLGSDKSWFPYAWRQKDGSVNGVDNEVLKKINEITGSNFKLKLGVWTDIFKQAKNKQIDGLTTTTVQEERRKYFNFSKVYNHSKVKVVVKHGNPLKIKTKDDLKNKVAVVQKDDIYFEKILKTIPNVQIIYKDELEDVYYEVIYGKADFTIHEGPTKYLHNNYGLPFLNIAFSFKEQMNFVFSIRNDWPEALSIMNKAIDVILKEDIQNIKNDFEKQFSLNYDDKSSLKLNKKEIAYIKENKVVNVCMYSSWNNYSFFSTLDDKKELLAFSKKVLNNVNLNLNIIKAGTWSNVIKYIKNGKCDLVPIITPTKQRAKFMNFTRSYMSWPIAIVSHKDTSYIYDLKSLNNKKIAVIKQSYVKNVFKKKYPNTKFIYVDNTQEAFEMLEKKQIDAYIDITLDLKDKLSEKSQRNIKINRVIDAVLPSSLGVKKDDKLLLSIVNKSLNSISEEEIDNIFNLSYLKIKKHFDYEIVVKIFLCVFLIFFVIIYWNFQLKKAVKKALIKSKEQEYMINYYAKQDAMKDLVGNISHQWKQPVDELSSLLFYLETKDFLKQKITYKDYKESALRARQIIDYLSNTISTFSNFYVLDKQKNDVYVDTLIKQAFSIISATFQNNNIKVCIDIKQNDIEIKGDELQQVILSILSNIKNIVIERSIKKARVNICLYRKNDNAILEIQDDCGGIQRVDEIFQLGSSSLKTGSGLGLYIAKRIVEDKYKGIIIATNTKQGAKFTIRVPCL